MAGRPPAQGPGSFPWGVNGAGTRGWVLGLPVAVGRRCFWGRSADGAEKSPARPLAVSAHSCDCAPTRRSQRGRTRTAPAAQPGLAVVCSPPSFSVGNSKVGCFVSKFKVENYASHESRMFELAVDAL